MTAAIREPDRLAALHRTALLDTSSEEAFDRLTRLVCRTLAAPVALVALVERDRQYFKSHVGLPEPFASTRQTPLTDSFCKHVVLTDEPLIVGDARDHPELKDNPAIQSLGVVAYLGVPLRTRDGLVLGSLCAIDHEPRAWTEEDVELLRDLAASVMTEIELRVAARQAREEEQARSALLESTGEGIYGIDTDGRCTFLNRAASEMLGYAPEEALGANMHALIHHSHPDGSPYSEEDCPIFRAFQDGEGVRVVDEALWRKDGTSFRAEYSSFPITREGRIRGAVITFTDVTERRRAEEEARRTATQLDAVLRQLAEGVIFTDSDGRILFVNGAAKAIHGVAELGIPVERYSETYRLFTLDGAPYPPEELPLARAVRRGEMVHDAEWRILRPDGTEVIARGSASAVRAPDGTRLGAVLTLRDVTEERRAERERERLLRREREARAEAERRAREEAALRRAAEAVSRVFTIEEVIAEIARSATAAVEADAVFVKRIRADPAEVEVVAATGPGAPTVGRRIAYAGSVAERVIQRGEPEVIAPLSEAGALILGRLAETWPDGSAVVIPLLNAGEAIGALVLVRSGSRDPFRGDEAERARTFADLAALAFRKLQLLQDSERKREELERVMESRSRLMRGFTHDVKNPLGAADGQLQILEMGIKGDLAPEQRESIGRTRASLGRALELIDDLVELARAETAGFRVERQPVDIREVAREMAEDYRAPAEAKGLRLETVRLPRDMPPIGSDASRIRQILGNLLSNAVKYTDRGTITVEVGTATEAYPDCVTIAVTDTGPGIPENQLPLLFREFSRGTSTGKHGAGLGLAISQRIADALGGRITVDSEQGRGSTFTLWLPLA